MTDIREKDQRQRFGRLKQHFEGGAALWDIVNELLDQHEIKVRDGDEHDLSLLVGASLGKALKTFDGIHQLCLAGWGEDALILLRSNVNLLINLGYILGDAEPRERAADFIAYSLEARTRYLKQAHGDKKPLWKTQMSDDEVKQRTKRWKATTVETRAGRVPKFHYDVGYRFYSSIEHSDAMALNAYIAEWNEIGPRVHAGPSDDYIEVALSHSVMTLADVLVRYCEYFKIERPDLFERINKIVNSMTA
jgi:hypothetical protein